MTKSFYPSLTGFSAYICKFCSNANYLAVFSERFIVFTKKGSVFWLYSIWIKTPASFIRFRKKNEIKLNNVVPLDFVNILKYFHDRKFNNFVKEEFFKILKERNLSQRFFQKDLGHWDANSRYTIALEVVKSIKELKDHVKSSIALIKE